MHIKIRNVFLTLILTCLFLISAATASMGVTQAGVVTTAIGIHDYANSGALQPDGKIVVAGGTYDGSNFDIALVRYNSDGSLDTTFSGDGKLTTAIGIDAAASCVALQPDGKIVVAGYTFNGSTDDFVVVRYNSDGSLDSSFAGTGIVITNFGNSHDVGYGIALQPDGKIVVAGTSGSSLYSSFFALARYNINGSLDTTFSGDGLVTTQIGFEDDWGYSVALQPDGKILVAGDSWYGDGYHFTLARYNSNGSLDTAFSDDGKLTTDIGLDSSSYSIVLQPDGKIVVAGDSDSGINYDFAIARYNSDGYLDTTFSGNGIVTTQIGSQHDWGYSVALQSNGKIVVVGDTEKSSGTFGYDFAVVRYNSDGSLDETFSDDGKLTTAIGISASAYSVVSQPDGKIVVVGDSNNGSDDDFAVARYNLDGSLDSSFSPPPLLAGLPGSLVVPSTDADGNYNVSWGASATANVTYVLEEATNNTFTANLRTAYTGTATNATISGRSSGVTYYYRVKSTKSGYSDSSWANSANGCAVTLQAGAPGIPFVPVSDANGYYTVNWSASVTAGVTYVLEEATNNTFTTNLRTAYSGVATSATISGRSSRTTYYYRVKATKAAYTSSAPVAGANGCYVLYPVRIGTTDYLTLAAAFTGAVGGNTIQAQAVNFPSEGTVSLTTTGTVTFKGGYDSSFNANPGLTSLQGALLLNKGTLVVQGLKIY